MASPLKEDYRRYGVQMPIELADIVDEQAKARGVSASHVIVELFRKGYCDPDSVELAQLRRDQLTLISAGPHALTWRYGDPAKRKAAGDAMAAQIASERTARAEQKNNPVSKKP